jgi:hypothetical protein
MNPAEYDPGRFRRGFVEDSRALQDVVAGLEASDSVGVDVEMAQRLERRAGGYQQWLHVLALIQLASDTLSVVVDPVRCPDLSPLSRFMAGKTRKVFLGGGQDAALLERSGIPARNVVDVGEVALAIFGRREDGMAALARRIFGLSLDKTVRRADWLVRPLNPTLLAYAHRDAELTLLIYRWFQHNYPAVTSLHERLELDPVLPITVSSWLREALSRPSVDPLIVLAEHGLDAANDADQLAADVRDALEQSTAPRQINRLLRIAGELGLRSLVEDISPFVDSASSLIRAAAARAIGQLADLETGVPILERLEDDPIEDVRKAADAGLRELRAPKVATAVQEREEEETSSLGENAVSALEQLRRQLEDESG